MSSFLVYLSNIKYIYKTYLFIWFCDLGPYLMVLRTYSWPCVQGSFLAGSEDLRCWGLNMVGHVQGKSTNQYIIYSGPQTVYTKHQFLPMTFTQKQYQRPTCKGSLWGLWILIIGEKLLFTGTLAPRNGLNRYGFGIPTPNTCLIEKNNTIWVAFITHYADSKKY